MPTVLYMLDVTYRGDYADSMGYQGSRLCAYRVDRGIGRGCTGGWGRWGLMGCNTCWDINDFNGAPRLHFFLFFESQPHNKALGC